MKGWRRRLIWLGAGAAVIAALYALHDRWLAAGGRWLDVGGAPRSGDYVLVLPGDAAMRPFVAAALVNADFAPVVLVPVNADEPVVEDGLMPTYAELTRRVLIRRGVPEAQIVLLPGPSDSTAGYARALEAFCRSRGGDIDVMVVTSWYHTRRSRAIFERCLPATDGRLHFVSAPTDHFGPDDWWRSEIGFVRVGSELVKLSIVIVQDHGVLIGGLLAVGLTAVYGCRVIRARSASRSAIASR
jgi:uncharacterized SAM-binding protein YcdF (DUF218 family)